MNTTLRRPSLASTRRPSLVETGSGANHRSAMIMTSAQTTRDGQSGVGMGQYENTYQLEPEKHVSTCKLQKIIKDVMTQNLTGRAYDANSGAVLTKTLSEQMKQKAKELGVPRYKFVSTVILGQGAHAAICMASRCVWNPGFDTFAEYTYKKDGLFATGVIYGVYVE